MVIEDKVLTIEGEEFRVSPLPAFKGLVYLKKLTKIIGPSIAAAFGTDEEKAKLEEGSFDVKSAVELLVENFDDDSVEVLIRDFMKTVTKNGQPINFDIEFMADYGKLFKLVTEVVKVNYGSVFQLGGLLTNLETAD